VEGGVKVKEPELGTPDAIVATVFKLLLAPSRSSSVTVPAVVGFHVMIVALPAEKE